MIVFTLLLTAVSLASAASLPAARCDFTGLVGAVETSRPLSTQEKAKAVAARGDRIGIVSEIGAGQEIARALINATENGGVVHESRSDYKTGASDALYGSLGPNATIEDYASRRRLLGQLSTDFDRVPILPGKLRFAIADAVETSRGNGHAWLGIKAETAKGQPPVTIVLHLRLHGARTETQKQDLAAAGVNLAHAVFERGNTFPTSRLLEGIDLGNVKIDFNSGTNHLDLLRSGTAQAVAFDANGNPIAAQEFISLGNTEPLVVRLSVSELEQGPQNTTFLKAAMQSRLDKRSLLVVGPHSPDGQQFLRALVAKDKKPRAEARTFDDAVPHDPLSKAARLNLERKYVMTLVDQGGRQGLANFFFDARNVGILFRSEASGAGESLDGLLRKVDAELIAIESKRPHRKAVVGNLTLASGEGFIVVKGQRTDNGPVERLVIPYRLQTRDPEIRGKTVGGLAVNALYAFSHGEAPVESLTDGLDGVATLSPR